MVGQSTLRPWQKEPEKLLWLRVCLIGRAATAFKRMPDEARDSYVDCMAVLKEHFDPHSRRKLYHAELMRCKKRRGAAFAKNLKVFVDMVYPELHEHA